jgi:hypothetical protein
MNELVPAKRQPKPSVQRARRNRRLEAAAIAMLAVLPLVPYFTFLLRSGVPRFGLIGDLAIVEHATRHVWTGETLVGAPSRFGWSQPGPLFFYFAAPFQALAGRSSTGIYFAATLINAAASGGIVACARMFARRAHAIAALIVVLMWLAAFGSVAASPFAPFLVVLPLLAFLVNAAMIARGKSGAVYPALVYGMFAAQTHVCAVPVVIAVTLVSLVAFFVGARRRSPSPELASENWRVGIAAAIGLILAVPPIVEQITAPTGNFRRIMTFFLHREAPLVPLGTATREWMTMMAWLPYRVGRLSLLHDGFVPYLASPHEMYLGNTSFPFIVTGVHVSLAVVCAIIAWKRTDVVSLALLATGALADLLSIGVLQAVVGDTAPYLVLWTSAASSLVWIGVLSTLFSAMGAAALKSDRVVNTAATPIIVVGLTLAVATATLQRWAFAKHPAGLSSHPELRPDIQKAYSALRDRLKADGYTPILHLDSFRDIALGFYVELEKDRLDVRTPDRALLVGARGEEHATKPLHLWIASAAAPHRLAACTEVIAKSGDLVVLGAAASSAPASCP